jgi:hypothetical protein
MTSEKAWTMLELVLFSPALSPIGLLVAIFAYPWRTRPWKPYVWIIIALSLPLLCMLALQAAFTLPAGSCEKRPLNNLPIALALMSVMGGAVLFILGRKYRTFIAGTALTFCPMTISWSLIATMSLAGCWI